MTPKGFPSWHDEPIAKYNVVTRRWFMMTPEDELRVALEAMYPMVRNNELYAKEMFVQDMMDKILTWHKKQVEELKKLNDNLTRNVFVEDSPALKVMVETSKQQKDIIEKLQARIKELEEALAIIKAKSKLEGLDFFFTIADQALKGEI